MNSAKVYVTVAHGTGLDYLRLAASNGTDAFGKNFESLDELETELSRARILRNGWMANLHQYAANGSSWDSPEPINITSEQIAGMGLQRIP